MEEKKDLYVTEINKNNSIWQTKIAGVSLPLYFFMMMVVISVIALGKLPSNMMGAIAVPIVLGNLFYFIGARLPIFKDYLGGGSVFTLFLSAALVTLGIIPQNIVQSTEKFINGMGFLDLYIAALIVGAIFGMSRDLLIKASVRYIPVTLISMTVSLFVVGLVGMFIGNGFLNSVLYIAFPAMAGGVGAGAVPLSTIYGSTLGTDSSQVISRLLPVTAMTNVLAIIGAALVSRMGNSLPKLNGHGKIMKKSDIGNDTKAPLKLDVTQIGVGLMICVAFFLLGQIFNYFIPKVHAYAFLIICVVLCKVTNILPKYYVDAACMFNKVVVKNLTSTILAAVGISLLNLNVLGQSLTWKFILLCLVSVVTISLTAGIVGNFFGLYPIEAAITAGMCDNSMGGTGNVAVLSAANRMELIGFAQMGNRLGGALILIISGFVVQLIS